MSDNEFISSETFDDDAIEEVVAIQEDKTENEFNQGLTLATGIEIPVEKTQEVEAESVKTLIAGMTEDELKAVLEKAKQVDVINDRLKQTHDSAFGRIGILEQTIKELKASRTAAPKITKETFKALSAYLEDDEMADALAKDFGDVQFGSTEQSAPFDMEIVNQAINEAMDKRLYDAQRQNEIKLLTVAHPDWRSINNSDEFEAWKKSLPAEQQTLLNSTWESEVLAKAMTDYKSWTAKKQAAQQNKQKRLEDNIQVGGGIAARNRAADDEFNQGLKRVLGK